MNYFGWSVGSEGCEDVKCASCNCNDTQTTLVELKCGLVFKGWHKECHTHLMITFQDAIAYLSIEKKLKMAQKAL